MITVRLKGGMGNQMFQYAFAKGMAKKLNTEFKLDLAILLDRSKGKDFVYRNYDLEIFNVEPKFTASPGILRPLFNLKSPHLNRLIHKLSVRGKNYIKEPHFHVVKEVLKQPADHTIYEGWWQSERYFENVTDELRTDFTFKKPVLEISAEILAQINKTNAVCLNVRRTDFLKVDALNTTNLDYFLKAAKYIETKVDQPNFFIFSDDIDWCRKNIVLKSPTRIVSHEHKGERFGNYMQLMKSCKHFIIPNSSFAWWAVWLNDIPDKIVIAPENWFNEPKFNTKDLVPKSWVRL